MGSLQVTTHLHWWFRNLRVIWWGTSSFLNSDKVVSNVFPVVLHSNKNGSSCLKNSTHSSWSCVQTPPQLAGDWSLLMYLFKEDSSARRTTCKKQNKISGWVGRLRFKKETQNMSVEIRIQKNVWWVFNYYKLCLWTKC